MPALLITSVLPDCLLLGDAPFLPDASTLSGAAYIAAGLSVLLFLYNQAVAGILNSRKLRAPGPEQTETDAKFAALTAEISSDMRQMEMRVEKRLSETIGSINTRLASLEATLAHVVADFNYALGKIDGRNS